MISNNAHVWAPHAAVTLTPARSPHLPPAAAPPRRNRATSWWGMTLLVAGLLGGWGVMGVGFGVFLGLLAVLWLWAGCIDKKGEYSS